MYMFLRAWHGGLPERLREPFLDLTLRDLFVHPTSLMNEGFVVKLSEAANFEIASATALVGRKPERPRSAAEPST